MVVPIDTAYMLFTIKSISVGILFIGALLLVQSTIKLGKTMAIVAIIAILLSGGTIVAVEQFQKGMPQEVTPASTYTQSTFKPIASLKDNSWLTGSGSFVLGFGTMQVNERPQYVYYEILPGDYDRPDPDRERAYKLGSISTDVTLIKEDGGKNPTLEQQVIYQRTEMVKYNPNPKYFKSFSTGGYEYPVSTQYILHVPNGTVRRDYNLDAELR